ncbi:MAG: helix-turn-helix domain-containing protein [Lewinellaceae bacterium]|nr:helix-turn-helix domain-containing protein [Lewinellaceae bacterium]HPR00090.1 helix-turn-helix domain-containing protein [Saprospiraceae bacterium]HQU55021.1 helix-turn-helix domain-containing protein [Saprospiraceae bacterium]
MKRISILVPEHAVMEAIADPRYLFSMGNHFLVSQGKPALFDTQLVGLRSEVRLDEVYTVHVDRVLTEADHPDLIIIPALFGDMPKAVALNRAFVPWIQQQVEGGAEVASLCVGAFLLASTGLLNGRKCSTHWAYYQEFRDTYPEVDVQDGSIITDEQGIYSSGGANSYWNLLLYLLEKYTTREIAILAAKYFAIDIDRDNQSAFAIFTGQKDHRDPEILKIQEYLELNYTEKLAVGDLAKKVALSRRSFERRFKQATGNTVLEYLQRIKIEAAKRNFETSRKNITEVMYDVGYSDTKAFRTLFKRITGLTPIEYRNKYQKTG